MLHADARVVTTVARNGLSHEGSTRFLIFRCACLRGDDEHPRRCDGELQRCTSHHGILLWVCCGANGSSALHPPQHHPAAVSYTHLRAHETPEHLVCRLLLEK